MAGQIKRTIDRILEDRGRKNPVGASAARTKMMLKGIRVDSYTDSSPDDPAVLNQLRALASELGTNL